MTPLLSVRDLTIRFALPRGAALAVDSVSFDLAPGEILGIVGESGSGKSQILFSLMGLLATNGRATGKVTLDGAAEGANLLTLPEPALDRIRGTRMAMIFEDPMTSLNPCQRVGDQLAEGLIVHRGLGRAAARAEAVRMLDRVRIPDAAARARRYPHEFSGGMRQRVMIAMALLARPRLLLADEPTTALDVTIQAQILDLLAELARETGTAIVFVTHDLGVVARLCDRVLVLYGGRVMEEAAAATFFAAPRHPHAHARGLLAATPRLAAPLAPRLDTIPGTPRAGAAALPGCPFAPRCPVAFDRCRTEAPALALLAPGHRAACHLAGAPP